MNAPLRPRPFPDETMIVRVPMSRHLYARLLAECVLLDRSPDILMREIVTCAFASGDMSPLFVPVESVASASSFSTKPQEQR